jgi:hypothetical protein
MFLFKYIPVMMAVMEARLGHASVTSSAVDFDPKPLYPADPTKYFSGLNMIIILCLFLEMSDQILSRKRRSYV